MGEEHGQRGLPRYREIALALTAEIESELQPGDSIAPEPELGRRFAVSRVTVRRAVDLLVQRGLVVRRQGSGTYVAQRKVTEELGILHGWTDSMRMQGLEPHTVDYEALQVVPPAWVAQTLCLERAEPVLRLQRLRYANGEPLCLMVDYLLQRFVPGLAEEGLRGESLYHTLQERFGLHLARVEDKVTARGASVLEGSLLGVAPAAPVLVVMRLTCLAGGDPIDAALVVSRADRYAYRVSGRTALPEPAAALAPCAAANPDPGT